MINRVNIYFEDEKLRKELETYSKKQEISFSRATIEFVSVGFSLLQKVGTLNIDLLAEKISRLERGFEEARKEIGFLKDIIENYEKQNNTLLSLLRKKENLPDGTEVGLQEEPLSQENEVEQEMIRYKRKKDKK